VQTVDFFPPIVDDPFMFGRIAAANALSDIYAMGGKPIMAIAILGWPLDKLPKETAKTVIEGARKVCDDAGITLAGGHSIDISDPIFGLAITGIIKTDHVKQNNKAIPGCKLFLTKPLGIGIITTAEKKGIVNKEHLQKVVELMTTLNNIGEEFAEIEGIKAMTDVTGFGLFGHLLEICESSKVSAEINFKNIPLIDGLNEYVEKKSFPGGTFRNWKSYRDKIAKITDDQKHILCDPQTSGGLLVAVDESGIRNFLDVCKQNGLELNEIGGLTAYDNSGKYISVI